MESDRGNSPLVKVKMTEELEQLKSYWGPPEDKDGSLIMIPVKELNMDRRQAEAFAKNNICSICEGVLTLAWINFNYVIRCGRDISHNGFIKAKTNLEILEEKMEKQSTALGKPVQTLAQITGQDLEIILKQSYPGAPDLEIKKALMICQKYGLDPLMKHIFLIKFQGKGGDTWAVVMGIKATRAMARRRLSYSYKDGPRAMTKDEQNKIFGEVFRDNLYAITILKDREGNEYPGYGWWLMGKEVIGADKGNTPWNMAFIRSERNALDKLMPEGSPPVEVVDENYIDSEAKPLEDAVETEKQPSKMPASGQESHEVVSFPTPEPEKSSGEPPTTLDKGFKYKTIKESYSRISELLKQKGVEIQHQANYIKTKFNLTDANAMNLAQCHVIIRELEALQDVSNE